MKKILSSFFLPLPIIWILLLVGLCLLFFTHKQTAGKVMVLVAMVIFTLAVTPLSIYLMKPLELRYPPLLTPPAVKYIVVLGGGQIYAKGYPPNAQLGLSTLSRLVEGIRLYRTAPGAKLLLSGGGAYQLRPEAVTMQLTAVALGVKPGDIVVDTRSRDTEEQAKKIKAMVGDQPFVLVSAGYHLPRAMALFEREGLHPVPAPTELFATGVVGAVRWISIKNINTLYYALHEYMGLLWIKVR
ncbi:MAG: ElyC/SanA/YdcF family protein [Gammaproteobacteria bacterium]